MRGKVEREWKEGKVGNPPFSPIIRKGRGVGMEWKEGRKGWVWRILFYSILVIGVKKKKQRKSL